MTSAVGVGEPGMLRTGYGAAYRSRRDPRVSMDVGGREGPGVPDRRAPHPVRWRSAARRGALRLVERFADARVHEEADERGAAPASRTARRR